MDVGQELALFQLLKLQVRQCVGQIVEPVLSERLDYRVEGIGRRTVRGDVRYDCALIPAADTFANAFPRIWWSSGGTYSTLLPYIALKVCPTRRPCLPLLEARAALDPRDRSAPALCCGQGSSP